VEILHHGAVRGVTGSCHELQANDDFAILVDCGLFQGAETSGTGATKDKLEIDFPLSHIKALVVTHVHIDHVGRIPYLLAAGFTGPIICSEPSATLLPLVLEDALKVGVTRNTQFIDRFLKVLQEKIIAIPYSKNYQIAPGCLVKLKPAGHILGSAYVEFKLSSPLLDKAEKSKKVIFSGDLGAPYAPLLSAPKSPYSCDTLVIESTYGDKSHEGRRDRRLKLQRIITRAVKDKGVVLIPAFSIGRTQELLYELEDIIHKNRDTNLVDQYKWDDIEIVVDSPLANKFTDVYRTLAPCWDNEAKKRKNSGRHPLSFDQLTTIDDHKTHLNTVAYLKKSTRPTIVLAASGMCAGGRIVNYLEALIEDKRTDILFVGYQANGTPGQIIQQFANNKVKGTGAPAGYVLLNEKKYMIHAQVHTLSGYSAHAGKKDLINFVKRMRIKPTEIRIIHGDEGAKASLKLAYDAMLDDTNVMIPHF
jgi:metallo-beta-lactamase family protein